MKQKFSYRGVAVVVVCVLILGYYFITLRQSVYDKYHYEHQVLTNSQK